MKKIAFGFLLAGSILIASQCVKEQYGGVKCSKYQGGGAVYDTFQVVCGKGQCVKEQFGVKCSRVEGGLAILDTYGAKCEGGCEMASS